MVGGVKKVGKHGYIYEYQVNSHIIWVMTTDIVFNKLKLPTYIYIIDYTLSVIP